MNTIITGVFTLFFFNVYSQQDTLKLRQIDTIVFQINTSNLPIQRDTIVQDYPNMGIKATTYLTMIMKDKTLFKFVNFVNSTRTEDGVERQMIGSNSFYYDNNELIKVEEYIIEGGKKGEAIWYYWKDAPIYYTLQSDKAADRADLLLDMSKNMLKQIIK
jgi:hypothetical protein